MSIVGITYAIIHVALSFGGELSNWNTWSSCSRTCGGGVAIRHRQCRKGRCANDKTSYAICNEKPCSSRPDDYRAFQCAEFNSLLFNSYYFHWLPFVEIQDPCSLYCRTKEDGMLIKMALKVKDGTKCGSINQDMCVDGKCLPVGCDNTIGSFKKLDACGICGGNGSTCNTAPPGHYEWDFVWGRCSVTCDSGYQHATIVCRDLQKGELVQENRCDPYRRPTTNQIKCVLPPCPSTFYWEMGHWRDCSRSCGGGTKMRRVYCAEEYGDGQKVGVENSYCKPPKPPDREKCNTGRCQTWVTGDWSKCSATCGRGFQYRDITCHKGAIHLCDRRSKPPGKRRCRSRANCGDGGRHDRNDPSPQIEARWYISAFDRCSVECGGGSRKRTVKCLFEPVGARKPLIIRDHFCPEPIPARKEQCNIHFCPPEWRTKHWSECSSTCGVGLHKRIVHCGKSDLTGIVINLPEIDCDNDPKPETIQECYAGPCYADIPPPPIINSDNATYIQLRPMKKVKLLVGGRAILLPRTSIVIKCPVKHFHKKLLFWKKSNKLVPLAGRVKVLLNGALKIRKSKENKDAGLFTCYAGSLSANINITFQSLMDAEARSADLRKYLHNTNEINYGNISNGVQADVIVPDLSASNNLDISETTYVTSDWLPCSVTCGSGVQHRDVTCQHITNYYVRIVVDRQCIKRDGVRPVNVRKCGDFPECPIWKTEDWSECTERKCVKNGYALRKRHTYCEYVNGTRVTENLCDQSEVPEQHSECSNSVCIAVWQTSPWAHCHPSCGKRGFKSRTLSCVWKTTRLAARDNCRNRSRPPLRKACMARPCPSVCEDQSRYCSIVSLLKMCRYKEFRDICCGSCEQTLNKGDYSNNL